MKLFQDWLHFFPTTSQEKKNRTLRGSSQNEREQLAGTLSISGQLGSGYGSVGKVVASDAIDPRFNSSHQRHFIFHLSY